MAAKPTNAQLATGAHAVAYRAEQLVVCFAVLFRTGFAAPAWTRQSIRNAVVESALSNARGLAYFFTRSADVHTSMYIAEWNDPVVAIAAAVEEPISRHLSHATKGAKEGEPHPGAWPVPEMAVALVGGLARFVAGLATEGGACFVPSPANTFAVLEAFDPLTKPTEVSENESVAKLTHALQKYLCVDAH